MEKRFDAGVVCVKYMEIKNITGLEKPLEKLVETISEGVGVLGNDFFEFDVKKMKRVGELEALNEKKMIISKAEGQAEAIAILDRAQKRFALEQYNKQINLENIFVKTKDDLIGKSVSEDPVEKDWIARFLNIAQNISREEIQNILAKILSGEIQNPGSFSYQTLETIKYLSKKDLERFQKFVALSTDVGVIKLATSGKGSLENYDLTFNDYMDLSSIGLFNQSSQIKFDLDLPSHTPFHLSLGADWYWISHDTENTNKKFDFGLYVFSNIGKELRSMLIGTSLNKKSQEFREEFKKQIENKGFKISKQ